MTILRLTAGALLYSLMLASTPSAIAQTDGFTVRNFRVEGLQRIAEGTVYNYLPINIGDTVDAQRSREAIRALFATGFFRDVELRRDGETLIIAVQERPSILSFTIDGNKDIKTDDLMQSLAGVGLRTGRTFDRAILEEVTQFLTEQYFSRGKYGVLVDTEVEELEDNQVAIAINVVEGERARIRQINLVGNDTFATKQLLKEFTLSMPRWDSWFRQNDRYAREALQGDLETLRSYYMDRGYADFDIESTQVAISPDKKDMFITINLREGDRYTIEDVRLAGQLPVPEEQLRNLVLVRPGQTFSQRLLNQTAELISFRLGADGYAFAEINPVPTLDRENKTANITVYIEPRNRVYVRRINFGGTDRVNDEVFRREMRQLEGSYLSNLQVDRSKIRIQRLPYIDEVDVETVPVPGLPDQVDLDFDIEYGLPGQFGGGLGYSASQKLILSGNFVHSNFRGTGQRVAAEISSGRFSDIYSLSHTDPYTNIDGVSRTLSLSYRDIVQFTSQTSDFSTKTLSSALEYAYPLSEFQSVRWGLVWQRAELLAQGSALQAQQWVLNNGKPFERPFGDTTVAGTKFDAFELVVGWGYDSRNRALFADRGARHRLSLGYSVPGSDVEYYTANYEGTQYVRPWRNLTVRLNLDLGYAEALGDTTSIPPFKNFFAGGPGTVRGFRESRLGPIDTFSRPYGGNMLVAGQAEIVLPIPETWRNRARFVLFYDIGNVFSTEGVEFYDRTTTFGPDGPILGEPIEYRFSYGNLRQSVGVGAEWLAPLGIFRFSYGIPLNASDGDDRRFPDETERFQFTIGSAF
jgi:outer membrane protein insertion porin family